MIVLKQMKNDAYFEETVRLTELKESVKFKTEEGVYRYFCTWFCK